MRPATGDRSLRGPRSSFPQRPLDESWGSSQPGLEAQGWTDFESLFVPEKFSLPHHNKNTISRHSGFFFFLPLPLFPLIFVLEGKKRSVLISEDNFFLIHPPYPRPRELPSKELI